MNTNGFTEDVVTLLLSGQSREDYRIRDQLRGMVSDTEKADTLRDELIAALSPIMLRTPPFVQQIVARALVDHVDWPAVARRAQVTAQDN